MKKQIYDEKNGMGYTLHGDYYLPDLVLREEKPTYGKYGMLRKQLSFFPYVFLNYIRKTKSSQSDQNRFIYKR